MTVVRTVKKMLLGQEIEHMLAASKVTQAEAAAMIETSQGRIAGLLSGRNNITPGDLILLATKLGFDDPGHQAALLELRRDSHKRGFWTSGHNRAYHEDLRLMIDIEQSADLIRTAQVEVMPGLTQCEAYVRAMYEDLPDRDGVTLDDRVAARLARQSIFTKSNPPTVHVVLSESCFRRAWGSRAVMREQAEHLVTLSNLPDVMIQVMPFDLPPGRRSPLPNPFTLLRVPSPGVAGPLEMAYVEGEGEIRYLDDKNALKAHESAWTRLSTAALSFDDSRAFIREFVDELRGQEPQ